MRAQELLPEAVRRLEAAGVPGASRDARLLMAHALGVAPDRLLLHLGDPLDEAAARRFEAALAAREARRPLSQITGQRRFWDHAFRVTSDTLDPRPETEILVRAALAAPFSRVLDLGTGTGAILLSLLAAMPEAEGVGSDLSPAALDVARENAASLGLDRRARFLPSDWFAAIAGRFDLIVSNPPYLAEREIAELAPEVRDWEPRMALTPGGDGLDAYRAIIAGAPAHLLPEGRILLEIGPTQAAAVCAMLRRSGFAEPVILPDLDGRDRVIAARWPGLPPACPA